MSDAEQSLRHGWSYRAENGELIDITRMHKPEYDIRIDKTVGFAGVSRSNGVMRFYAADGTCASESASHSLILSSGYPTPEEPPALPEAPRVTKRSLLETAISTVAGRGLNYGSPEDNFARIAAHWSVYLENRSLPDGTTPLSIRSIDVAQMMVLMKIARLENSPKHTDSWVDIAGYAACGGEIADGIPTPVETKSDQWTEEQSKRFKAKY